MLGNSISSIRVIVFLLVGLALTGCQTGLHKAAEIGDTKTVSVLLDKGNDVNELDFGGMTPLLYAVEHGRIDTVKLLLDRGADIQARARWAGEQGSDPLSAAAALVQVKIAKLLIDRGADIDAAILILNGTNTAQARNGVRFLERYAQERKLAAQQPQVKPQSSTSIQQTFITKADVDELPSVDVKPQKNSYAIVIGIEKYRQKLPNADHAVNDAKIMTEYLTRVMGYPAANVVTLANEQATKSDFEKYFEKWLFNNVEKDSSVFIYYSGHGAPNSKTGDAYLVPYDGDPSFIEQTGYPLKRLYASLNQLQVKEIIVAIDSCFSGAGGKSVIAQGARPLVMNLEQDMPISKKMIVMSASSGSQISSTYEEKVHGLFTYYLLKGIKDGKIEVGELFDYIKPNVESTARKIYNNEQTPQLMVPDKQRVFLRY